MNSRPKKNQHFKDLFLSYKKLAHFELVMIMKMGKGVDFSVCCITSSFKMSMLLN